MTRVAFAAMDAVPLRWLEVAPDGETRLMEGAMDSTLLGGTVGGAPTQVRAPWDASVFINTSNDQQPVNWLAGILLRQSLTLGQSVRGTMVVFGPPTEDGDITSIDDTLREQVMASVREARGQEA